MPCEQKSGISYTVRCIGFISVCHNDSLRHYGEADAFSVLPASALWLPMHCYYSLYVKLNRVLRRRWWHPTPVLSPGKSHGRRSLVGCSPWGCEELDMTEQLPFHFPLSCIGEGNGNPLQCSCLENPRDRAAWWAAIYGVAQSWTWLKRLSSSRVELEDVEQSL